MTAPGPQQPDEEWVGHWTDHDGQSLTDVQREEAIAILLEFGNVEAANALRPAAPSAQPDEVAHICEPIYCHTCEAIDYGTPAQPVRDTGEGRR